jgi:TrmH family RNA methyltransferase
MPKEFYISDKSDRLTFFKSLIHDSSFQLEQQKCLIFGKKIVSEQRSIQAFLTTEAAKDDPLFASCDRYILSESAFKKLSGLIHPEPYGALITRPSLEFPKKIKQGLLILDTLSDPGNIGTIFRTAWGLGLEGVILIKGSVHPYHPKVLRASKGACLSLPWVIMDKTFVSAFLASYNLTLYGADLEGADLATLTHQGPFALILGHESKGICDELKKIAIPVHIHQNHLESYNVAIASAIISYTLLQKRAL